MYLVPVIMPDWSVGDKSWCDAFQKTVLADWKQDLNWVWLKQFPHAIRIENADPEDRRTAQRLSRVLFRRFHRERAFDHGDPTPPVTKKGQKPIRRGSGNDLVSIKASSSKMTHDSARKSPRSQKVVASQKQDKKSPTSKKTSPMQGKNERLNGSDVSPERRRSTELPSVSEKGQKGKSSTASTGSKPEQLRDEGKTILPKI